jgi:hypothetical protein
LFNLKKRAKKNRFFEELSLIVSLKENLFFFVSMLFENLMGNLIVKNKKE